MILSPTINHRTRIPKMQFEHPLTNKRGRGCKKGYVEWITEFRQEATALRRVARAIVMMAQGKSRTRKYP
jgi:hypothetical protein